MKRYLSLFSGIEAASAAWGPLGWECVGVSEIDAFACSILAHHHPDVPNLGDVSRITEAQIVELGRIDLVVFGSPCQDLSVAGLRKGLEDGTRSSLFFQAIRIVQLARRHGECRFALWENVPGAFSSNAGADFAAVVGAMAGAKLAVPRDGWGNEGVALGTEGLVEWCVLDAQWFGVAQRRRRVFALADFGDWAGRPPLLLEPEDMRGDSAPSREAGKGFAADVAPSITASGRGVERAGDTRGQDPVVAVCVTGDATHALTAEGFDASEDGTGRGTPLVTQPFEVANTLTARMHKGINSTLDEGKTPVLAFDTTQITSKTNGSSPKYGDPCHPLTANSHPPAIAFDSRQDCVSSEHVAGALGSSLPQAQAVAFQSSQSGVRLDRVHATLDSNNGPRRHNGVLLGMQVRRLTPIECERLQGFPDGHTNVVHRNKPAADGPRYKALGNSMAVPVMRWIGQRIQAVGMIVPANHVEAELRRAVA